SFRLGMPRLTAQTWELVSSPISRGSRAASFAPATHWAAARCSSQRQRRTGSPVVPHADHGAAVFVSGDAWASERTPEQVLRHLREAHAAAGSFWYAGSSRKSCHVQCAPPC